MNQFEERSLIEKVELLAGDRPKGKAKGAVRLEDLMPLLQIQPLKAQAPAGGTPTAQEYGVLMRDVKQLHDRLSEIANALQARLL